MLQSYFDSLFDQHILVGSIFYYYFIINFCNGYIFKCGTLTDIFSSLYILLVERDCGGTRCLY
jgi:hypothetical protein